MDHTVHGTAQARILEWVAFPFSRGSSQPRDRTQVSCIAGGFFTSRAETQGKPKNTGVHILSLLQRIFPTQESNQDPLHCRWILYQLSTERKKVKSLSRVWLFATLWTVAYQAPPSMGFSRQEYWSGLPYLLQEIFPTQGLNLGLPHCRQTLYRVSHQGSPEHRAITKYLCN